MTAVHHCSKRIRTVPRNDRSVLVCKRIMTKCKFVRCYWRKASGAKGMRQRDLCREWSTQAEANIEEAKKAGLFWRYYSKL